MRISEKVSLFVLLISVWAILYDRFANIEQTPEYRRARIPIHLLAASGCYWPYGTAADRYS